MVRNQVLRWNGRAWSQVRAPEPAGTTSSDVNILNAIRCMSATRCLAVGLDGVTTGPPTVANEALLWNGKKWSTVKTPQPGGTTTTGDLNVLVGLTCASPTSCLRPGLWHGGHAGLAAERGPALERQEWSLFEVPNPDGTGSGSFNELSGDFCSNSRSCWAVGSYAPGHAVVARSSPRRCAGTGPSGRGSRRRTRPARRTRTATSCSRSAARGRTTAGPSARPLATRADQERAPALERLVLVSSLIAC